MWKRLNVCGRDCTALCCIKPAVCLQQFIICRCGYVDYMCMPNSSATSERKCKHSYISAEIILKFLKTLRDTFTWYAQTCKYNH